MFMNIYHTYGNCIPISEIKGLRTGNLGGRNCDTYTHHLNVCKQAVEGKLKSHEVWQTWTKEIWKPYCKDDNPWDKFIEEYYLWDYVDEEKQPKSFVVNRSNSNQVGVRAEDSDETILETINQCIELIIMRNYRIEKGIKTAFNYEQGKSYETFKQNFFKGVKYD
jgi:hypothetical protein